MGFLGKLFSSIIEAALSDDTEREYDCPLCGTKLIFHDSELDYFKTWDCPKCGNSILDQDIEWETEEDEDDEDEEYIEADYDIPEGCAACGGDYPNCVDSCPMFDD